MPAVSVIIPTYKHEQFVLATLDSVFAQTFKDYEVIVVNDGSPDGTHELLQPLVQQGLIRYFRQENRGQAAARNRGLAEAKGKFVAFLDDDDLWPCDKLQWQVDLFQRELGAALVYGGARSFEGTDLGLGEPAAGDVRRQIAERCFIVSPGQVLFRAELLREVGAFDETLSGVDDWDMYLRLSNHGPFVYDRRLALRYRVHSGNASRNFVKMYMSMRRLQLKHVEWISQICGGTQEVHRIGSQIQLGNFANAWSWMYRYLERGDHGLARQACWSAILIWPGSLRHWSYWVQIAFVCVPNRFRQAARSAKLLLRQS